MGCTSEAIWASALEGDVTAGGPKAFFDDRFVRISQTAYMHPASDKVLHAGGAPQAECYGRNRGDIESADRLLGE